MIIRDIELHYSGDERPLHLTIYVPDEIEQALNIAEVSPEELLDQGKWYEYLTAEFLDPDTMNRTYNCGVMVYGVTRGSRGYSPVEVDTIVELPEKFRPLEIPLPKVLSLNNDYTEALTGFGLMLAYDAIKDVRRDLADVRNEIIEHVRGRITPETEKYDYVSHLYARLIGYSE